MFSINWDEDEQFLYEKLWFGVRINVLIGILEMDEEQLI